MRGDGVVLPADATAQFGIVDLEELPYFLVVPGHASRGAELDQDGVDAGGLGWLSLGGVGGGGGGRGIDGGGLDLRGLHVPSQERGMGDACGTICK